MSGLIRGATFVVSVLIRGAAFVVSGLIRGAALVEGEYCTLVYKIPLVWFL